MAMVFTACKQPSFVISLCMSDYFTCNVGVRQGENLSPLLFAKYLNDFESYVSRHYKGLDTLSDDITCHLSDPDIEVFLRLHVGPTSIC